MYKRAFTLIEIIIYLALFSIILGGAIVSAFSILEYNDTNETHAHIAGEANFLLSKIDYYLSGAETIQSPKVNFPCSGDFCILSVTKYDISQDIAITKSGNILYVSKNAGMPIEFSGAVPVTNFRVSHNAEDTTGREKVTVDLTLEATTSRGTVLSQDFETTYYLKQ